MQGSIVSEFGAVASVVGSARPLFGRRLAKRISGAAMHIGRMITMASRDRDRALDKAAYQGAEELRAANCTLAAIALSEDREEARLYLQRVVHEGIAHHLHKTRLKARLSKLGSL